ncbi:uncharacterized protein LOC108732695 isoform X2 [Agrilus planipennis]|uniref:Uncharacterized protein LOC108732695 isoform X2 n=1 Tax=Agrilus planipennis TaxID=224129 RepID=A0A1W4WGK7_AGRPL|nr:uncharacterized protein LOC108732695 isoform X2 [Agrilus planipennis]
MSSSDDEENLELFKEATDVQFINDSMFINLGKSKPSKEDINKVAECPERSLRTARNNRDDGSEMLNRNRLKKA